MNIVFVTITAVDMFWWGKEGAGVEGYEWWTGLLGLHVAYCSTVTPRMPCHGTRGRGIEGGWTSSYNETDYEIWFKWMETLNYVRRDVYVTTV